MTYKRLIIVILRALSIILLVAAGMLIFLVCIQIVHYLKGTIDNILENYFILKTILAPIFTSVGLIILKISDELEGV